MRCVGRGAFELCLPSLGFFVTKCVLRNTISGRTLKTSKSRGEEGGALMAWSVCDDSKVPALDVESDPGGHEHDDDPEYDVLHMCSYWHRGW